MKTLLLLLVPFFITACNPPSVMNVPRSKYYEEPYTLNDGTPCIIIRGGTHSGMVGVTCNYEKY